MKQYKCEFCGKEFRTKGCIKSHIKYHIGENQIILILLLLSSIPFMIVLRGFMSACTVVSISCSRLLTAILLSLMCCVVSFHQETNDTSVQSATEHLSKVQISNDTWQGTEMRRSLFVMIVVQPSHVEIT